VGVRAEAVAEMMDDSVLPDVPDPATVTARFPDHVTAKLAIEKLVRDVPVDRRSTELSDEGEQVMLEVTISKLDLDRVTEILRRAGGELSP